MKVAIRDGMRLQLSREPARFTREPRRVLVYRQGDRRAVVWRSDLLLMGRHGRPYTVMLLRERRRRLPHRVSPHRACCARYRARLGHGSHRRIVAKYGR